MNTLQGNLVKLRALEPEDLEFLFAANFLLLVEMAQKACPMGNAF